jgi:hypothetical protein
MIRYVIESTHEHVCRVTFGDHRERTVGSGERE